MLIGEIQRKIIYCHFVVFWFYVSVSIAVIFQGHYIPTFDRMAIGTLSDMSLPTPLCYSNVKNFSISSGYNLAFHSRSRKNYHLKSDQYNISTTYVHLLKDNKNAFSADIQYIRLAKWGRKLCGGLRYNFLVPNWKRFEFSIGSHFLGIPIAPSPPTIDLKSIIELHGRIFYIFPSKNDKTTAFVSLAFHLLFERYKVVSFFEKSNGIKKSTPTLKYIDPNISVPCGYIFHYPEKSIHVILLVAINFGYIIGKDKREHSHYFLEIFPAPISLAFSWDLKSRSNKKD